MPCREKVTVLPCNQFYRGRHKGQGHSSRGMSPGHPLKPPLGCRRKTLHRAVSLQQLGSCYYKQNTCLSVFVLDLDLWPCVKSVSEQVQKEREARLAEIDMLECHIMQAQARSTSADVRTTNRLYSDFISSHPDVFVPPGIYSLPYNIVNYMQIWLVLSGCLCIINTNINRSFR